MDEKHLVRIGRAGWGVPRHVVLQFPPGSDRLNRYSQVFSCCEINSSFYRPHRVATWQRWAASVPCDFRFAVKVPRTITHEARLAWSLTGPSFCTTVSERVYITAMDCESWLGRSQGLQAAGAGGL